MDGNDVLEVDAAVRKAIDVLRDQGVTGQVRELPDAAPTAATAAAQGLVRDIQPGNPGSRPEGMVAVQAGDFRGVIFWADDGVHGDEPSATNTAPLVAHYLASAQGEQIEKTLDPIDAMFLYEVIQITGEIADMAERVGRRLELLLAN